MTHNVFSGTLSLTQSVIRLWFVFCVPYFPFVAMRSVVSTTAVDCLDRPVSEVSVKLDVKLCLLNRPYIFTFTFNCVTCSSYFMIAK